jgi:hypothetical protein
VLLAEEPLRRVFGIGDSLERTGRDRRGRSGGSADAWCSWRLGPCVSRRERDHDGGQHNR